MVAPMEIIPNPCLPTSLGPEGEMIAAVATSKCG
jgi:hypothetical protein